MTLRTMRPIVLALAGLLVGVAAPPLAADEIFRHSGTVIAIEGDRRLVLEEIGPWQARDGAKVIRWTIELTPATEFTFAFRDDVPGGFRGGFVEGVLDPAFIDAGDAVTVECRHAGGLFYAEKVTVVDPAQP